MEVDKNSTVEIELDKELYERALLQASKEGMSLEDWLSLLISTALLWGKMSVTPLNSPPMLWTELGEDPLIDS